LNQAAGDGWPAFVLLRLLRTHTPWQAGGGCAFISLRLLKTHTLASGRRLRIHFVAPAENTHPGERAAAHSFRCAC
jgi:hypothetical protein